MDKPLRSQFFIFTTTLTLSALIIFSAFVIQAAVLVPYSWLKQQIIEVPSALDPTVTGVLVTVSMIILTRVFQSSTTGGDLRNLGFEVSSSVLKPLTVGAGFGFLSISSLIALEILSGGIKLEGFFWDVPSAYPLWYTLGAVLPRYMGTGISEELIFRGYLFHLAVSRHGRTFALLFTSMMFSLMHMVLPGYNIIVFVNATLAGLLFTLLLLRVGNLWASVGMHTAWNYV